MAEETLLELTWGASDWPMPELTAEEPPDTGTELVLLGLLVGGTGVDVVAEPPA